MFLQIMKTKEVPEQDVRDMLDGSCKTFSLVFVLLNTKSVSLYQCLATSWSLDHWLSFSFSLNPLLYLEYRRTFTDNTDEENINYHGENNSKSAKPHDNYIIVPCDHLILDFVKMLTN